MTPAFPKLVYVLDEHNCLKARKYDYITELAVTLLPPSGCTPTISPPEDAGELRGQCLLPHGLPLLPVPWKDANGNYQFEGRFSQGVVSLNPAPNWDPLPRETRDAFWKLLDQRLQLCFEALDVPAQRAEGCAAPTPVPIHWQYGAIARLPKGAPIEPLLYGGYSSISLGYIGLYEVTRS
ncbi:MAG: anaerobic ribonucleoside-triphosphate reductase [Lawsonibacter sp.]